MKLTDADALMSVLFAEEKKIKSEARVLNQILTAVQPKLCVLSPDWFDVRSNILFPEHQWHTDDVSTLLWFAGNFTFI
jgi:hypothetical protein